MMTLDESMVDDHPRQQPPGSDSRARTVRLTLRDWARFVLPKGKLLVSIGGKVFLSALEFLRKAILAIPWLVICLIIAMFIGEWIFEGPGMTVSSFSDPGGDRTVSLGQAIADALTLELQRIDQLDTAKNPWGREEEVYSLRFTTPQAYERVGTISVGGSQLPVGELVLALKALLPHWHPRSVITGSIQRSSSGGGLPVRIIVRLEENGRILKHWTNQDALATEEDIQRFVRTVAFEMMWSMGKGKGADSLENFQQYIDGVEKFRRYKDMRADQDFWDAEQHLSTAIAEHPGYVKAHYYLATLYSWRAVREEVNSQLAGEYEQKARRKYEILTSLQQSDETQALGHFGLGLLAYRHYRREQRINPRQPETASLSDPTLEEADRHFTAAIDLDSTLYFARTGRARVYEAQGCIEQAIREFQQARQSAKDQSSQSWIDEQIEALKAPPRRPLSTSASHPLGVG